MNLKKFFQQDQAESLRALVAEENITPSDIALPKKIHRLIDEVRKEMTKKYNLKKDLSNMNWNEKAGQLPSEAWMIEQILHTLELYIKRATTKKVQKYDEYKGGY